MKIKKIEAKKENKAKKRVAAYARVSTLKEEQEESFESQVEYYTRYIKARESWEFVGIYADQGKSGLRVDGRTEFLRMIDDALAGAIDLIIVKSVSRFGRNGLETREYVEKLKAHGVEVYFEREQISSTDPEAEMILNFISAICQEESRSLSDNIRISLAKQAEKGIRHIGSNHCLGYDEIDGVLVPNEDAWIVKLVYEEYAAGKKLICIAEELNEKGARRMRTDKPWNEDAVSGLLHNEIFCGDRLLQKAPHHNYITKKPDKNIEYTSIYVENAHEGIVSRELWEKCQVRRRLPDSNIPYRESQYSTRHFLAGRLFCGECGSRLMRRTLKGKGGTMQKMWKCKGRIKGNGCTCPVVTEEELLRVIAEKIGTAWDGNPDTFDRVERVDIYAERRIEVTASL